MALLMGLYVTIPVILVVLIHLVQNADQGWSPIKTFQGWTLHPFEGSVARARDPATCIAGCVLTHGTGCLAATYTPRVEYGYYACLHFTGKKIRMKQSDYAEDVVMLTQWVHVLVYSEQITFVEARPACGKFGGRLMNWDEAVTYYNNTEVNQCNCAWLENGDSVFMSPPDTNYSCADGVAACTPYADLASSSLAPLAHAWCRINEIQ